MYFDYDHIFPVPVQPELSIPQLSVTARHLHSIRNRLQYVIENRQAILILAAASSCSMQIEVGQSNICATYLLATWRSLSRRCNKFILFELRDDGKTVTIGTNTFVLLAHTQNQIFALIFFFRESIFFSHLIFDICSSTCVVCTARDDEDDTHNII